MADAPKIILTGPGKDSLRSGSEKINQAIDNANAAKKMQDGVQEQIDALVVNGDSSPAIAQALADTPYTTLREKLIATDEQLADKAEQSDLNYRTTKTPYIVVEGDSTAAGGTAGASMALWLSMMLKREIINNAVWGSWTYQVKDRLKANVLDLHPKYCVLLMGTNDIYGGENRKTSLDNYEYILDTLIDHKIEPIVLSVLPRNDFPARNADIRIFNSCLLHMCQEKSIKFVDLYNPLAKSDGTALDYVLHNADNLHWATYGAVLGAREVLKAFQVPKPNNADYPYNLFKGEYPMIENGIFTADSNADGLANFWTATSPGNTTFSLVSNPKGGNFQVINKTTSTASSSGIYQTIGALTENATYRLQCELEFTLSDRTDGGNNNASVYIAISFFNSTGAEISTVIVDEIWYSTGIPLTEVYQDFTPPVGTASSRLTISANATSPFTLKIGGAYMNIIR